MSKLFLIKNPNNLMIINITKMIIIVVTTTIIKTIIMIIIIIIIIIIMIKWRNTSTALTAPNTELSVTYNSPKAANITKSSTSNATWVLYAPQKRLIHHLTWWIGVDHAAWLLCLELSPTWFLKKTHNGNINKHNCNNVAVYIYMTKKIYEVREHFAILIFNKYLVFEQALPSQKT